MVMALRILAWIAFIASVLRLLWWPASLERHCETAIRPKSESKWPR